MIDSKHLLLLNVPIQIVLSSGEIMKIKTPSIEEYEMDVYYKGLTGMFNVSLLELQLDPETYGFIAENYSELLVGFKMYPEYDPVFDLFEQVCGATVEKNGVFYKEKELTEQDIETVRKVYLISLARLNIDGSPIIDEVEEKVDEYEAKIARIRGKSVEDKDSLDWHSVILLLVYELNMSIDSIKKMNYFGLKEVAKIANLAPSDKIEKIAAGNGNLKDYKNIVQKR